ncbi:MAG: hypothetical protein NXI09_00765 [Bacteroidetes bacterium]|nr:hypothetical protein [Bacteroidota bacterium]
MKHRLLLLLLPFLFHFTASAQSGPSRRSSVSFTPSDAGYQVSNIALVYGFRNCYGNVVMAMNYNKEGTSIGSYLFEGKWYSANELNGNHNANFRIDLNDLEADLYLGSSRLGSVRIDNLVGFTSTGCFGETYDLLSQVGQNSEDARWKESIKELSLRNIRVVSADSKDYKLHEAIRSIQKNKEFEDLKSQAETAEANENWSEAKSLYQKASYINEREAMQAKADEMSAKIKDAKNADRAASLAEQAENLASNEEYSSAAAKYESAASIDEQKSSEYQAKADEMRQKQNDKESAAAEQESSEEEQASEEETEESEDSEGSEDSDGAADDDGGAYDEARAKSAAMEDYERQQRMNQYYENRNQASQENMLAAGEMGAQAILVHLLIGQLIYSNMSAEAYSSHMAGPGNRISGRVGYSLSSVPIFTNSSSETYDGNNFGTSNSTDNYQSFTLELGGGFDYWPIYSERFGLGASIDVFGGHGLLFQQFSYGGSLGFEGFIGGPGMQIYASYRGGFRNIYHEPWIDPGELGSGKAETAFSRITVGPQFRSIRDNGADFATFGVLGILERNYAWSGNGGAAALFNYSPGIRLEWNKRNRFCFGAEAVFNYRRVGEKQYNFDSEATFNGTMYNIGFQRRFDRFHNSALRMRNPGLAYDRIRDFEGFYLSLFQPSLTWVSTDSSFYRSTEPFVGVDVIGFHYMMKLYKGVGFGLGIDAIYSGVRFDADDASTYYRSHRGGLSVPFGLRFHLPGTLARYYAEAGYSFHYYFYSSLESRNPREIDGIWSTDEDYDLGLKNSYGNYRLAIGMAFPGPGTSNSVGLVFERSTSGILDPDYSSEKTGPSGGEDALLNRLSIQFAIQF